MNALEILKNNGVSTEEFAKNYTLNNFEVLNCEISERRLATGWNEKVFSFTFDNPTNHPSAQGVISVICEDEIGEYEIYDIQYNNH